MELNKIEIVIYDNSFFYYGFAERWYGIDKVLISITNDNLKYFHFLISMMFWYADRIPTVQTNLHNTE